MDDDLTGEVSSEGFGFIDRLITEWREGVNRFDGLGEVFLGAVSHGGAIIAVGGVNRDLAYSSGVARLRHLYIRRAFRSLGIASDLVGRLERHARLSFHTLRLRTDTTEAAGFYERRGYLAVDCATATHVLNL